MFVLRDDETIDLESPPGATLPGRLDGVAEPRLLTVLERQPDRPALLSLVFLCPEKCSVERMRFTYSLAKGALQEHMERLGLSGQSNVVSGRINIYAPCPSIRVRMHGILGGRGVLRSLLCMHTFYHTHLLAYNLTEHVPGPL